MTIKTALFLATFLLPLVCFAKQKEDKSDPNYHTIKD